MNKAYLLAGAGLILVMVLTGCVSKGFVRDEITKSRDETKSELTKTMDKNISDVKSELSKRIVDVETNFATKDLVNQELYKQKQAIMKEVDTKIEDLKALVNKLKEWQETFAFADKEDITKVSQDIKTMANVFWKQINEQIEGLKRSLNELEKLSLPQPSGGPETTPPKGPKE